MKKNHFFFLGGTPGEERYFLPTSHPSPDAKPSESTPASPQNSSRIYPTGCMFKNRYYLMALFMLTLTRALQAIHEAISFGGPMLFILFVAKTAYVAALFVRAALRCYCSFICTGSHQDNTRKPTESRLRVRGISEAPDGRSIMRPVAGHSPHAVRVTYLFTIVRVNGAPGFHLSRPLAAGNERSRGLRGASWRQRRTRFNEMTFGRLIYWRLSNCVVTYPGTGGSYLADPFNLVL